MISTPGGRRGLMICRCRGRFCMGRRRRRDRRVSSERPSVLSVVGGGSKASHLTYFIILSFYHILLEAGAAQHSTLTATWVTYHQEWGARLLPEATTIPRAMVRTAMIRRRRSASSHVHERPVNDGNDGLVHRASNASQMSCPRPSASYG